MHDLWPELRLPGNSLLRQLGAADRAAARAGRHAVRIARDELRRIRELSQTIKALEAEIADLVPNRAAPAFRPRVGPVDCGQARR